MSEFGIAIIPCQRILDRSDAAGRAQFQRELEDVLLNSRPGGALSYHLYWGRNHRLRCKDAWSKRITFWSARMYMHGWQAAERYHGVGKN